MNINRLNYENYFLLYVDGELSTAEMQTVERFAAENKDLADELNMLLLTKLPEETFEYKNKSSLLRTASEHINHINYEERFLYLIDEELTSQQKDETLLFVSNNPQYQGVYNSLQQTKLPDEPILFPNKESLYRREDNKEPVVVMQWWKLAVAAVIIGIMAMTGIFIANNSKSTVVAKANKNSTPELSNKSIPKEKNIIQNNKEEQFQFAQTEKANSVKSVISVKENYPSEQYKVIDLVNPETHKQIESQETIVLNTPINTSTENLNRFNTEVKNNSSVVLPVKEDKDQITATNYTKPAVYKELDTEDESKSLYVGSIEINKDKFRGFLRKASSLFKGKNKNEEEKTELSNSHTLE